MSDANKTKTVTDPANASTPKTGFASELTPFVPPALFDRVRAEAEARRLVNSATIIGKWFLAQIDPTLIVYEMAYQKSRNETIDTSKLKANYCELAETPIEANYRDGLFVTSNGCHRNMLAIQKGKSLVTVLVHIDPNGNGVSFEDEAKAFSNQSSGSTEMTQHDTFEANLIWGDPIDTAISQVCTEFDISVTRNKKNSEGRACLTALNDARNITRAHKYDGFHWCVSTIEECGWLQSGGLNNYMLTAMRQVYRKHSMAGDLNEAHGRIIANFFGFHLPTLRIELVRAWPYYPDVRKSIPLLVNCVADGKIMLDSNCNLPIVAQLKAYKETAAQYVEENHRNKNSKQKTTAKNGKSEKTTAPKNGKTAIVHKTRKQAGSTD